MYFVMDAHSFYNFIYFILLIIVSGLRGAGEVLLAFGESRVESPRGTGLIPEDAVNIKAEVATSLLGETQLLCGIVLQLHFAANMRKERKTCSSGGRYTSVVAAAASTTSLLVLQASLS